MSESQTEGFSETARQQGAGEDYDVRKYGAVGDGVALDGDAINRAIEAARESGGGRVVLPAGRYLSFSIRLRSDVEIHLSEGAVLVAASPEMHGGAYDAAEPNAWDAYQDYGHSHWRNSLIWGENLRNVAITGTGLIDGSGLTRWGPGPRRAAKQGDSPVSLDGPSGAGNTGVVTGPRMSAYGVLPSGSRGFAPPGFADEPLTMEGQGNKAIALKLCTGVVLRDFSILRGGHFAMLATGVEEMTIEGLRIDTNRDGLDIDCCRNVRVIDCTVNSPNDDGVCLKSSYALGEARATEHVTVRGCKVMGYDVGTFLDGTYGRTQELAPDKDFMTGRIKCGTESNGGFRDIAITDCVCERSRGIALETVDGGIIEDVTVSNIVMREVTSSPLFLRLGNRARGPEGTVVGKIRRVTISNVTATEVHRDFPCLIAGLPGNLIENVRISNVRIQFQGGGTAEDAAAEPPERENAYPEPSMFGALPAYGFYIRHARNVVLENVEIGYDDAEARGAVILDDVIGAKIQAMSARETPGAAVISLRGVSDVSIANCPGVDDIAQLGGDLVESFDVYPSRETRVE